MADARHVWARDEVDPQRRRSVTLAQRRGPSGVVNLARRLKRRGFFPTGIGPETAVTGVTGADRFRYRSVSNRPNSKLQFEFKK